MTSPPTIPYTKAPKDSLGDKVPLFHRPPMEGVEGGGRKHRVHDTIPMKMDKIQQSRYLECKNANILIINNIF